MAPFKQPQKRRKSTETVTARSLRSRTVSRPASTTRNNRSTSRYSTASRASSNSSSQGQGQPRGLQRRPSTRSERPVSVATSRTFGRDDQSRATTEPPPEDFGADLDVLNEVIMAVNLTDRGNIGCAYYVARQEKLYFMEDARLCGPDTIDART